MQRQLTVCFKSCLKIFFQATQSVNDTISEWNVTIEYSEIRIVQNLDQVYRETSTIFMIDVRTFNNVSYKVYIFIDE